MTAEQATRRGFSAPAGVMSTSGTSRRNRGEIAVRLGVAFVAAGLCGVALWLLVDGRRSRTGRHPTAQYGRPTVFIVALAIGLCSLMVVVPPFGRVPSCAPPPDATSLQMDTVRTHVETPATLIARILTAAPTGFGLLLSRAGDADVCFLENENLYVVRSDDGFFGHRAVTLGSVVLSRREADVSSWDLLALYHHESRHRTQWALGTVLGGPLAFPLGYSADDLVFPGRRNHFELLAGVKAGGYNLTEPAPARIDPPAAGVAALVLSIVECAFGYRRRRRDLRALSRFATPADPLRAALGRRGSSPAYGDARRWTVLGGGAGRPAHIARFRLVRHERR